MESAVTFSGVMQLSQETKTSVADRKSFVKADPTLSPARVCQYMMMAIPSATPSR